VVFQDDALHPADAGQGGADLAGQIEARLDIWQDQDAVTIDPFQESPPSGVRQRQHRVRVRVINKGRREQRMHNRLD